MRQINLPLFSNRFALDVALIQPKNHSELKSQSKASSNLQTVYTNCNTNHFIAANMLYILKYNYLINSENGS